MRLIIFGALCDFIALVSGAHKLTIHQAHLEKSPKIESGIFKTHSSKRSILVTFGSTSDMKSLANQISEKYGQYPKEQRIYALYEAFNDYSLECQGSADSYLKSSSYTYTKMWASNIIAIKDADLQCAETLAQMSDVTSITTNKKISLAPVEVEPLGNGDSTSFGWGRTWGLSRINVEEAWKFRYGENQYHEEQGATLRGEGVIIGQIDSGMCKK
ncbi:unnamed protein product [Orchesella dallaii]|uniref:Uncharacterized protein n=1 Tax=Orchesella dallaii TaxID=48710 RepID=A0ABP1QBS8_9HEXA